MERARLASRRVLPDVVALAWLAVIGGAFLAPALSHGHALGPYDLQGSIGLTAHAHAQVHNAVDSDEIQEFIPWQVLSWLDVHAGHLPLWDPYDLLGMPLGFNFQSAPFSLTIAVSYLFPLGLAHTATLAARLLLAGSGTYVLCRTLRLGVLSSVVGATVFELCGAFTILLGDYEAGVYCLAGWVLAASVLLLRGERRAVPVLLLSISLALAFAAGEPQVDSLLVAFVAVFAAVVLIARRWGDRHRADDAARDHAARDPVGHGGRILFDHLLALLAASGLVAPLYLPSGQLLVGSARSSGPYVSALQPSDVTHLLFASYDGVPTNLGSNIGIENSYVAMIYIGAVALVLALTGLAWLRRRPEVAAAAVLVVLLAVILFAPPIVTVMRHLPELDVFRLDLATPLLDFAIAILAAFGAQALLRPGSRRTGAVAAPEDRAATWLFIAGTVGLALVLAALGAKLASGTEHLDATQQRVRDASFLWPAVSVASCALLATVRALSRRRTRPARAAGRQPAHARVGPAAAQTPAARALAAAGGRVGVGVLVAVEAAFCIIGGAWFLSSTAQPLKVPPAVAALKRIAGDRLVGLGTCKENAFANLGVMPNMNAAYGMNELIGYDPIIPTTYYSSFGALVGVSKKPLVPHVFCPEITSVRAARFYGVSYVLEPPGKAGPPGTTRVTVVGGEGLYAVPGSGRVTLAGHAGTVTASETAGGTWRVKVDATRRARLVLRITSVPGWQATIDGRPLPLHRYDTVMLSAIVPPGHHVVTVVYAPPLIDAGLVLAALSAVGLLGSTAWGATRRRRRERRGQSIVRTEGPH